MLNDDPQLLAAEISALVSPRSPQLAASAFAAGLGLIDDQQRLRPVPLAARPVVVTRDEQQRRTRLARELASAAMRMAQLPHAGAELERALSPLERALVRSRPAPLGRLAITRVDFLDGPQGLRALEVNATIPALAGYADVAALALIDHLARRAGLPALTRSALAARHGDNAAALHRVLCHLHERARRGRRPQTIALCARRGDAQLPELEHLAARFRDLGSDAAVAHPDQLVERGGWLWLGQVRLDLVYRHVFVRRLEREGGAARALVQLMRSPPQVGTLLLNPPAADVELKQVLALLSRSVCEPALADLAGLGDAERTAVAQALPWTRVLAPGPSLTPAGRVADLVAHVSAAPHEFVLKPSFGHGGEGVLVGADADTPVGRARAQRWFGAGFDWPQLCALAAADRRFGCWVVQEAVLPEARLVTLATPGGADTVPAIADYTCFASPGVDVDPGWGGAARCAGGRVVNVSSGGGIAPVLQAELASLLLAPLRVAGEAPGRAPVGGCG